YERDASGTWARVCDTCAGPTGRREISMAFDAARGQSVFFGGDSAQGAMGDFWAWDGGAHDRPAQVFSTRWSAARGPDPHACSGVQSCAIRRVSITWRGDATLAGQGGSLELWRTGGWDAVASHDIGGPAPHEVTWSSEDPQ